MIDEVDSFAPSLHIHLSSNARRQTEMTQKSAFKEGGKVGILKMEDATRADSTGMNSISGSKQARTVLLCYDLL